MQRIEMVQGMTAKIVADYQARICAVEDIISKSLEMLEESRKAKQMTEEDLKETLSREESLRKKDFDTLMEPILCYQNEREKQIRSYLGNFLETQRELSTKLKRTIEAGLMEHIDEYERSIQANIEETKRQIRVFQDEYHRIRQIIQYLFDRREALTIHEFKKTVAELYQELGLNHITKTTPTSFGLREEAKL